MPSAHVLPRRLLALVLLALSSVTLLLLLRPVAAQAAPAAAPVLTGHEQRVVLDLIDDICGDTWCEGDYRFDFRDFGCAPAEGTCTLRLRLSPYTDGVSRWYWRSGRVRGFVRFDQMVQTSPSGAQSLQPVFYDAVNALVNRVEATVPSARPRPGGRLAAA